MATLHNRSKFTHCTKMAAFVCLFRSSRITVVTISPYERSSGTTQMTWQPAKQLSLSVLEKKQNLISHKISSSAKEYR